LWGTAAWDAIGGVPSGCSQERRRRRKRNISKAASGIPSGFTPQKNPGALRTGILSPLGAVR
jgi:hypothetical protein